MGIVRQPTFSALSAEESTFLLEYLGKRRCAIKFLSYTANVDVFIINMQSIVAQDTEHKIMGSPRGRSELVTVAYTILGPPQATENPPQRHREQTVFTIHGIRGPTIPPARKAQRLLEACPYHWPLGMGIAKARVSEGAFSMREVSPTA